MNALQTVKTTTSSLDFLKVINEFREDAGKKTIRNNVFLARIADELDDLGGLQKVL